MFDARSKIVFKKYTCKRAFEGSTRGKKGKETPPKLKRFSVAVFGGKLICTGVKSEGREDKRLAARTLSR
jgi:hypothetical protein